MGSMQHPLYSFLTSSKTNPNHHGKIMWNFNKFLISSDGTVLNRFGTRSDTQDASVDKAVAEAVQALNKGAQPSE